MGAETRSGLLAGKIAVVTGGASGIGAATVRRFVAEGARVVIADVNDALGQAVASEIGERARFVRLDVSREDAWRDLAASLQRDHGQLDVLMNNASIQIPGTIETATYADWSRILRVNLDSAFLGCHTLFPLLKNSRSASIVNVSSNSAVVGYPLYPAYSAAKAALHGLTRSIAAHTRAEKIPVRCNTLIPGGIDTPLVHEGIRRDLGIDPHSDLGRSYRAALGHPDQLASAALFLASDESSFVSGTELLVDHALSFSMIGR